VVPAGGAAPLEFPGCVGDGEGLGEGGLDDGGPDAGGPAGPVEGEEA
jgi:hypothetical protein